LLEVFSFCCFWGERGCFVYVVCGVFCLIFLLWLEDDQSENFAWSSSLSSSLGAKKLLGSAGLPHYALMLAKI
jgi:hypothetical protein